MDTPPLPCAYECESPAQIAWYPPRAAQLRAAVLWQLHRLAHADAIQLR